MSRNEFVIHLINEECYPDEECDSNIGQLWRNALNGSICYVPYEDYLPIAMWCHVIYELKINPPLARDADYHVYQSWREYDYRMGLKESKKNQ